MGSGFTTIGSIFYQTFNGISNLGLITLNGPHERTFSKLYKSFCRSYNSLFSTAQSLSSTITTLDSEVNKYSKHRKSHCDKKHLQKQLQHQKVDNHHNHYPHDPDQSSKCSAKWILSIAICLVPLTLTNLKEQKRKLEQTNKTLEMKKEQLNKELASTKSDLQAKMNAMETMKKKISENKSADDSKKISRKLEAKEDELKQMAMKVNEFKNAYEEASKEKELQQKDKDQLKKELYNIKKLGLTSPNSSENKPQEESHIPEWGKGHMKTKPTAITANMQQCPSCSRMLPFEQIQLHFDVCIATNTANR